VQVLDRQQAKNMSTYKRHSTLNTDTTLTEHSHVNALRCIPSALLLDINLALCNKAGAAGRFVYRFCVMRAQKSDKATIRETFLLARGANVIDLY
jgi:hypothetical protein